MFGGFDPTAALLALTITSLALWLLQPVAQRLNLLDHPVGRKDHAHPTPVTGGLAILVGCIVVFFAVQTHSDSLLAFCGASLLLVIVGVFDDLHDLRWYWRILAQAAVPVLPGDSADTLAARVLTQEHLIYPRAVADLLLNM